ncbi:actin-like protein 8 [Trichosurus vulpecula]|uniref:actin-like protein 8 n=1 Tax=Trichosurus vulpecula TaxID=9337 RepID=UPI00186B20C5|nr:actin-like protein 8 [Trichosurus vulpecula]
MACDGCRRRIGEAIVCMSIGRWATDPGKSVPVMGLLAVGSTFILLMASSSVVIDVGSAWCKVGLAEKNYPTLAIPTVVGYQPYHEDLKENLLKIRKVTGLENMHVIQELPTIEFPVNRGQILNWEDMEAIWHHIFDSLRVKTKNHSVLVTELPWKDRNYKQKILEVMMETFNVPSLHFGNQAELALFGSGLLTEFIINRGTITNWDAMEFMWHYIFSELNNTTKDHSLLITGLLPSDNHGRQKITEVMMETFNVPSLHIGNQAELALFGSGFLTGMVVNCGAGLTHIAPILGGQMISNCAEVYELGGLDISSLLYKSLFRIPDSNLFIMREAMEDLKEKLCYTPSSSLIDSAFVFLMEEGSVVIDIGSDLCRAGLAGRNHPTVAIPTVIGFQAYPEDPGPSNPKKRKILGLSNMHLLRQLPTEFPIQRGQIMNWDAMESILNHSYDLLGVKAENHHVLLTGILSNPLRDRQKLMEVMMETFCVPSLYIGNHPELCLFGSGFLTGLVLHSGAGVTSLTPVCSGRVKFFSNKIFEMAGQDVSSLLYKALFNVEMNMASISQRFDMDLVKERLCYVSKHPNQKGPGIDSISNSPGVVALPDGKVITLPKELRTYPDMFFSTSQHDLPNLDLSSEVVDTIMKCNSEEQAILFSHVVLSGGNTIFSGFPERLLCELNITRPHWFPSQVVSRPNRIYLSWVGGSILSCLSTFYSQCLTNKEYQEAGRYVIL